MITVLIPVLKTGYLESQLYWLEKQTHRDFNVIIMDVNHAANRQQPWMTKKRSYPVTHLQLIHNINFPKRCDFSIKNNLALLAPTNHFLFMSDTHYPAPTFIAQAGEAALRGNNTMFKVQSILSKAYKPDTHEVNTELLLKNYMPKPVFLFDRRTFFYVLNGFDEALTYASDFESIVYRTLDFIPPFKVIDNQLYHISHLPTENQYGRRWRKPCEKCTALFSAWKFYNAYTTGTFPATATEEDAVAQMTFRDPDLGIALFQCPNCGFGGILNPAEYERVIQQRDISGAPISAFEGRTGRNLGQIYETMTKQCDNNIQARFNYLLTTY